MAEDIAALKTNAGQTGGISDCALIAGQQRSLYEDRKTTVWNRAERATSAATLLCAAMRTGNGGASRCPC